MAEAELAKQLAQIETMTNVELRAELKRHGCSTTGIKKDLLAKLRNALQKEYEQNLQANHSVGYSQNETPIVSIPDQQSSLLYNSTIPQNVYPSATPMIPIPQQLPISPVVEAIPMTEMKTPEKKTRTRSKKPSVDAQINEISNPTANEPIALDISTNDDNIEMISFVSKNSEENERESNRLGGELHLSSLDSSSAKSESIVKEIPLSDEQQRLNQSKSPEKDNQQSNTIAQDNIQNHNDVDNHSSIEIKPMETTQEENEPSSVDKPSEKVPSQEVLKPTLPQPTSFMKTLNRSTVNKINLSLEFLQTLIPDTSLASESVTNDELDAYINDQSFNESTLETNVGNDFLPTHSMTIGELADQKYSTNRTVVVDITNESSLNDDINARKKQYLTSARVSSFESKTLFDGKTNTVVTDEPVRIKEATANQEPLSRILYIRGLTRPFSLSQLKGLLARYGTLVDGEFWLDKIKSQCFVTYMTIEEAQDARQALDGCRWPSTNPKALSIRFGRQDELDFSKAHDLSPDEMSIDSINLSKKEKSNVGSSHNSTNGIKANRSDAREWDKQKRQEDEQSGFLIPDEGVEDDVEEENEKDQETGKTNETSAKGLDDYFRKTKTKPSIYWLPLTDEQIIERIRRDEERKAERDEKQRKREIENNSQRSNSKSNRRSLSREKRKHSSSPPRRNAKRH